MTVTRLLLVRHGATTATEENRFSGATEVLLSDEGRRQVTGLGLRLSKQKVAAIYASPQTRAMDTARILATHCAIEPQARDGLREISHGHWEGLRRDEVERRFAAEYESWEADPFTFAPEGGESGVAVLARALPVVRELVTRHVGEQVVVVSHKATLRLILSSFLGFDARGFRDRLDQSPACLSVLDFKTPVHARLMLFNDTGHYASEPRVAENVLSKWWVGP